MPFFDRPEGADHFVNQVRGGVGNADAEADARAHRRFALLDDGRDGFTVLGLDLAASTTRLADQFVDGFPAIRRLHVRHDLFRSENVAEIHTAKSSVDGFRLNAWAIARAKGFREGRRPQQRDMPIYQRLAKVPFQ